MKTVSMHEARTQLSRLLRRVAAGEDILIANRGVPVARPGPRAAKESAACSGNLILTRLCPRLPSSYSKAERKAPNENQDELVTFLPDTTVFLFGPLL
jgi:antitoxin (DNA-binding transcriptional repressor) of toxin-antitoxin stability system